MKTLFERIGSKAAVSATVAKMYDKILADDILAPFFENVDVNVLRLSQSAFVTYAFGGPNNYTGKSLRQAHKGSVERGLRDMHFDLVAKHLRSSMQELNVDAALIEEALAIVETTRNDVLNK